MFSSYSSTSLEMQNFLAANIEKKWFADLRTTAREDILRWWGVEHVTEKEVAYGFKVLWWFFMGYQGCHVIYLLCNLQNSSPPPTHTINVSMVSLIFVTMWRNLVGIGIKLYPNAIHFHTYSIYIGVFIYFPISFDKSRSLWYQFRWPIR